jgi:hypothetical protein
VSCDDDDITGTTNPRYVATMIAANEQNPNNTSTATGTVTFVDLGDQIEWTMALTNITAVTASHIHLGPATAVGTTAGPVIINLFLPNRPTGTINGEVARGTITNANNSQVSLDSLRVLFNNANSYANIHTSANPAGEIRDQIRPAN